MTAMANVLLSAASIFRRSVVVGARAHDGSTVFYPLVLNLHQDGILRTSSVPTGERRTAEQAGINAVSNYAGAELRRRSMAMECFITPEGLLINELAPRVHNSADTGAQNGASISQFELHLRAITTACRCARAGD